MRAECGGPFLGQSIVTLLFGALKPSTVGGNNVLELDLLQKRDEGQQKKTTRTTCEICLCSPLFAVDLAVRSKQEAQRKEKKKALELTITPDRREREKVMCGAFAKSQRVGEKD